jgi:hypothetical protein
MPSSRVLVLVGAGVHDEVFGADEEGAFEFGAEGRDGLGADDVSSAEARLMR